MKTTTTTNKQYLAVYGYNYICTISSL